MTSYGMTYEGASDYIDRYNAMVDRSREVTARYASGAAPSSQEIVSTTTGASTPLGDAQPFEYTPDAESDVTFDLAKTPNEGEPGTWYTNPGSGQMRMFGDDGQRVVDFDFDHDHGQGAPHAHNWGINPLSGKLERGSGLPFSLLP
jgi:hypothetical protein